MERILNLDEAAQFLKCTRRRVNDLCKRGELPFKPDGRYNKKFKESDLIAYLNRGYGFHKRPTRKRAPDRAKELAKAQAQMMILQDKVYAMKREEPALNKLRERWCLMGSPSLFFKKSI
jgi:hypothetical protein